VCMWCVCVWVCVCRSVAEKLQEHATSGEPIDMQDLFFKYTVTSFCEIGFGHDLNGENFGLVISSYDMYLLCFHHSPFCKISHSRG